MNAKNISVGEQSSDMQVHVRAIETAAGDRKRGERPKAGFRSRAEWICSILKGKTLLFFVVSLLLSAANAALLLIVSLSLRGIIDSALEGNVQESTTGFYMLAVFSVLTALIVSASKAVRNYSVAACRKRIQNWGYEKILTKKLDSGNPETVEYWMGRLNEESQLISLALMQQIPDFLCAFSFLLLTFFSLLMILPVSVLALIPAGISQIIVLFVFSRSLKSHSRKIQLSEDGFRFFVSESLKGLPVIRTFARREKMILAERERARKIQESRKGQSAAIGLYTFLTQGCLHLGFVLGVGICSWALLSGYRNYGTIVAVLQLIRQTGNPFSVFIDFIPNWERAMAGIERFKELAEKEDDPLRPDLGEAFKKSGREIRVSDLDYSWPGKPRILKDFSCSFRKGGFYVVKGPSGSGKSTLLKLLLSLLEPEKGCAEIVMESGETIPVCKAGGIFSYVPQDDFAWASTVTECVTFKKNLDEEEMKRFRSALDAALCDFVTDFDSDLGQGAEKISRGQRQRLAIARAVYSERPVMILDEATSALDTESEEKILENLLAGGRTVIMTRHPVLPELSRKAETVELSQKYSESFR